MTSLRVAYDAAVVSFNESTGFAVGDFFGTDIVTFVKDESSMIHLTITMTQGQNAVVGSGDLGLLTFTGKSPGSTDMELLPSELHFYDSQGTGVTVTDLEIESATISVQ